MFCNENSNNAQIIKNIYKYVKEYADNNSINICPWVNPYESNNVDHDNLCDKPFYGLIVSGHYVNYIKHELEDELNASVIIQYRSLDVILENTLFGYYVTGMVPVDKDDTNTQMYNSVESESVGVLQPSLDEDDEEDTDIYFSDFVNSESKDKLPVPKDPDELLFSDEHKLKYDLGILWNKETGYLCS